MKIGFILVFFLARAVRTDDPAGAFLTAGPHAAPHLQDIAGLPTAKNAPSAGDITTKSSQVNQFGDTKPSNNEHDDAPPITSEVVIRLDHHYAPKGQNMTFVVDLELRSSEFFYFEVYGKGTFGLTFYLNDSTTQHFDSQVAELEAGESVLLVPISTDLYAFQKGVKFEVFGLGGDKSQFSFYLRKTAKLTVDFDQRVKLLTKFTNRVNFSVHLPPNKYLDAKDYRLQFFLQSSLQHQKLVGHETMEMYINSGGAVPGKKNHHFAAGGNSGTGLIKTVSKVNPYYCVGPKCEYTVSVYISNIHYIYFFPTVFENGATIQFERYLYLLEELEAGEVVTYECVVPKIEGNWIFSIEPIENVTDVFINPDVKPNDLMGYKYRSSSESPENILVTKLESEKFGFDFTKFYVTYRARDATFSSVFKFEITKQHVETKRYVREFVSESGVAAVDEILNYYLDLKSETPQTFNFKLNLFSFSGHADFYLKECLPRDLDCKITPEDVKAYKSEELAEKVKERIIRYSALDINPGEQSKSDVIALNFNCNPKRVAFENSYSNSETCLFVIGIHCRDSQNKYGAFYRFEIKGEDLHLPLSFDTSNTITLHKGQSGFYKFDLSSHPPDKQFDVAGFRAITLTGKADLFFSRRTLYPSEADNDLAIKINDVAFSSLHSSENDGLLKLFEDGQNPTAVYLSIQASAYTVLDLYSYLFNHNNSEIDIQEPAQFNKQMHRKMNADDIVTAQGRRQHMQNFLITVPDITEFTEAMVIHVNSDVLGFRLCLQLDVVMFDRERSCDLESENESLEVPPQTLAIHRLNKLGLSVQRRISSADPDKHEIDFTLSVSLRDFEEKLAITTPGRTFTYSTSSRAALQIAIDLTQMKKTAFLTLHSDDPQIKASVYAGIATIDRRVETLDKFKFGLKITDAKKFKQKYCETKCLLHLEVSTSADDVTRFSLTYTVD